MTPIRLQDRQVLHQLFVKALGLQGTTQVVGPQVFFSLLEKAPRPAEVARLIRNDPQSSLFGFFAHGLSRHVGDPVLTLSMVTTKFFTLWYLGVLSS